MLRVTSRPQKQRMALAISPGVERPLHRARDLAILSTFLISRAPEWLRKAVPMKQLDVPREVKGLGKSLLV